MRKFCSVLPWLVAGAGAILILLTLSPAVIYRAADAGWGPVQKLALASGLMMVLSVLGMQVVNRLDERLMAGAGSGKGQEQSSYPATKKTAPGAKLIIGVGGLFLAVELLYIGLVSVWHFTYWPPSKDYYNQLAEAFLNRQTYLQLAPPLALAELENPYTLEAWQSAAAIGDLTYFEGKYYIYWGPVPAVLISAYQLAGGGTVEDKIIVFAAVSLIFLFLILILLHFQRSNYPNLPGWLLGFGFFLVGTAQPMLWVLNSPDVYEAAIASGQAFLLAGVYFALPLLEDLRQPIWRFGVIGAFWALALGSRITVIGSILVFILAFLMIHFDQIRIRKDWMSLAARILILFAPLGIMAGLLGLYNYTRFGSLTETGLRYQLSVTDMGALMDQGLLFNPIYLWPNLAYYLVTPVRLIADFPFLRPAYSEFAYFTQVFARFRIPDVYTIYGISGLLFGMPVILFTLVALFDLLCKENPSTNDPVQEQALSARLEPEAVLQRFMWTALAAGIASAIPTILYFYVATRFMLDAIPLFSILATLGIWRAYSSSNLRPIRRVIIVLVALVLGWVGFGVSFILALSGALSRFDDLNPALYRFLVDFFGR